MRQLTSLDAQFLNVETASTCGHVGGLAIYDPSTAPGGKLDVDDVCRLVMERLPLLPPFRWRLAEVPFGIDHPYWVEDPDFDIRFHVRDIALAPPGDDSKLAEQIARIHARPLDRRRPLWELYLIHGLPGGRVAMQTKIHHAVVDGVSGAEVLSALLDIDPAGRDVPEEIPTPPRAMPTELEMLGRGLLGIPRQPIRALRGLPTTLASLPAIPGARDLPGVATIARLGVAMRRVTGQGNMVLDFPHQTAPQTPFNDGRISPHRRFSFGQLSLDAVKRIKDRHGVTVNDVVVTLCAGAVRRWLIDHEALPAEPLIAMVPMSVRTKEQMGTFGNRVSMMIVPIPTDQADPLRRLEIAHETLASAKERHKALPADALTDATQFIPPAVAARAARTAMAVTANKRLAPALNIVISNVPGPRLPLYCAGAKLEAQYPVSVITDGMGLNITVMSYLDHLDFGVIADREMVPDVDKVLDYLRASLEELQDLSRPRQAPRLHATRPRSRPKSRRGSPRGGPA